MLTIAISIICSVILVFWLILFAISLISGYRKRRAVAWLDISRALTSTDPKYINAVLITHNKKLDKYIKQALKDRKQDLEVEQELNSSVNDFQDKQLKHKTN